MVFSPAIPSGGGLGLVCYTTDPTAGPFPSGGLVMGPSSGPFEITAEQYPGSIGKVWYSSTDTAGQVSGLYIETLSIVP